MKVKHVLFHTELLPKLLGLSDTDWISLIKTVCERATYLVPFAEYGWGAGLNLVSPTYIWKGPNGVAFWRMVDDGIIHRGGYLLSNGEALGREPIYKETLHEDV